MANLNRWEGIGRLGNDIELRYMPNGDAVANFNIAVDDSYKDKQGQKVEKTEWVRCVAFGKTAEFLGQWLHKGKRLLAVGKLKTREYEKDGIKRYTTEIVVDMKGTLQLLGGKEGDGTPRQQRARREAGNGNAQRPAANSNPSQQAAPPDFDDEIPFRQAHYLTGI